MKKKFRNLWNEDLSQKRKNLWRKIHIWENKTLS